MPQRWTRAEKSGTTKGGPLSSPAREVLCKEEQQQFRSPEMSHNWEIEVVFPQQGYALAKNRLRMNPECTVVLQSLQVSPNPVPGSLCGREGQSAVEQPVVYLSSTGGRYFPLDNPLDHLHHEYTESKWCFVNREWGEILLLCFQKGTSGPMWQAPCLAAPCAIS